MGDFSAHHSASPSSSRPGATARRRLKTRLRVRVKRYHGVARWTWNTGEDGDEEEVCGICQSAFEGVAPGVKYPGDECPVVWGKCKHAFHLQCVSTWLSGRNTCPICRQDWEFAAEKEVGDGNEGRGAEGGEEGKEAEL